MTLLQRWRQTALHNKALVITSVLVAFGTVFYAGAAAFQIWLMKESMDDSAIQQQRLVAATNNAISKAVSESSASLKDALTKNKV
jgi:hypothetical protein